MQINFLKALLTSLTAAIAITSCSDDKFSLGPDPGEGQATLSAEILFRNYTPALSRTPGTALNGIDNLFVIIFNGSGDFVDIRKFDRDNLNITSSSQTPPDGTGVEQPVTTDKASFSIDLPYGKYRIYGAANIRGEYETRLRANCDSETALKAVAMEWNPTTIADNDQMFGVFDLGTADKLPANTFDAQTITINRQGLNLSGWMRRLGSKVTVGYDPTGLYEGVTIYIKQVTIHDIAKSCPLGESNKPAEKDELIETGGTVTYYADGSANDRNGWLRLQKGTPGGPVFGTDHSATAEALFFYENNQGDFKDDPDREKYNKTMNPDEMADNEFLPDHNRPGGNPGYVDWKDKVPYGTYVEVEAYYVSANPERPSSGPIRYRFMLGKNTTYDYNAQRNHHFKLTLCFRGWANEPDWHIDYDEPTPSIHVPEIYYISYLYNQQMNLPLRIVTGNNSNAQNYILKSEIIENNWAPYDPSQPDNVPAQWVGAWNNINGFAWNKPTYNSPTNPYRKGQNFVGFLSVRRTDPNKVILYPDKDYRDTDAASTLKSYYDDNMRAFGEYPLTPGTGLPVSGSADNGTYDVKVNSDKSLTVSVPMYTRAKQMIPSTDFTANNPYASYMRRAVVRFTLWDKTTNSQVTFKDDNNEEIKYKDVPILQVRRIVNPKAIWRKASSTQEFNVKLMRLETADATTFTSFPSEGAWRATILVDPDGLIKLTKDGKSVTGVGSHVDGSTGSHMEFTYQPTGTIAEGTTRCGIIEVEYHDYTCKHLIFVRQGYDAPVTLGGKKWSNYNAYATSPSGSGNSPASPTNVNVAVTKSPLSIGSYFKRLNYAYAIRESNSKTYGWLQSVTNRDISTAYVNSNNAVVNRNTTWGSFGGFAWTQYTSNTSRFDRSWADTWTPVNNTNIKGNLTIPTYEDYIALQNNCDFGYGVVYGDGASEMATTKETAYGYIDENNSGVESTNGIRACVVYNRSNGNQIIFPLGYVGQGRRARSTFALSGVNNFADPGVGAITYSGARGALSGTGNMNRPITYNLYRSAGALYWFKQPVRRAQTPIWNTSKKRRIASWDINYFNLVFNSYDSGSLGDFTDGEALGFATSSDALPIRLIYK